jgi:RNA polymerase sigma-70 factor (ECF subfamily)
MVITFDWREIPSEALEQRELREALNQALKSLPEKYRTVLVLRDVQQMSIAETAKVLGISEENVKTRTSRARLQMRDLMAPGWEESWAQGQGRNRISSAQLRTIWLALLDEQKYSREPTT